MRHPVLVILIVGAVLSALLYPVTHMKIGIPEASVLPDEYESRAGDDILKQDFDYASLSPMQIVASVPRVHSAPRAWKTSNGSATAYEKRMAYRVSRASTPSVRPPPASTRKVWPKPAKRQRPKREEEQKLW